MLQHFDTVMSFAVVMLLLSLLVTTLVQMVVATLGLRSSVLQGGLKRLLVQAFPQMQAADADKIAQAVLQHPMLEHVNGRRATCIRKEELIRLLGDIVQRKSGHGFSKDKVFTDAKASCNAVTAAVQTPEFAAAAKALKEAMEKKFPTQAAELRAMVDERLETGRSAVEEINSWFDTVMDRTTENFLAKTRWVTAGVAAVLAFYLHVDSLSIIRQLASQPELRAKLIQSADATLQRAENTMALTVSTQAMASAAIAAIGSNYSTAAEGKVLARAPRDLATRGAGEDWLKTNLENSTNQSAIIAAYHEQFEEKSKIWLGALRSSAKELNATLRNVDLTIIPSPTPPLRDYVGKSGHFFGTLMTVFFLSLGAPFWFNALRQLANLRPAVAEKIDPKSKDQPNRAAPQG